MSKAVTQNQPAQRPGGCFGLAPDLFQVHQILAEH